MRIELPAAPWADAAHRADVDVHTLTVAPQPAVHRPGEAWTSGAALTLRTRVETDPPATVTLTF